VAARVERHERGQLRNPGVDPTPCATVLARYSGDEEPFVERQRAALGQPVDPVRVHPGVDRAGDEGEAAWTGSLAGSGLQGDGGQHERRGLAHREYMVVGTQRPHGLERVLDVLVEPEPAVGDRDVPGVVPVQHVHVVVGEHGAHHGPQQRGEVPGDRPDEQRRWLPVHAGLGEVPPRGERGRQNGTDRHVGDPVLDRHRVDPPVRSFVRWMRGLHDPADRREPAQAG